MLQCWSWRYASAVADGEAAASSTPSGEEATAGAQRQDAENRALREQVSVQTAEITELKRRLAVTEDQALTSADAAERSLFARYVPLMLKAFSRHWHSVTVQMMRRCAPSSV